ncbi:MAG TPA: PilW family protein [Hyphomicrobiales bacterium]|nr:PilW family protein [Hyphomicrobiales bacterium]
MDGTAAPTQQGLSLLELIIALALGAALSAGVIECCLMLRQADRVQRALADMQQSARFIHALLQDELRRAGNFGCDALAPPLHPDTWLRAPLPSALQAGAGIAGWEATNTGPATPIDSNPTLAPIDTDTPGAWRSSGKQILATSAALPHTDILQLWGSDAATANAPVLSFNAGISPLLSLGAVALDSGDFITVSDCTTLTLLQVCRISAPAGQPPRRNLTLGGDCKPGNRNLTDLTLAPGSEVSKLNSTLYYLSKRGRRPANPPALFRRTLRDDGTLGTPEELVEGVASLQLRYSEHSPDDAGHGVDHYVTADRVSNWHKVISVHVALLLQSLEDQLVRVPQPYDFNALRYDGTPGNGPLPTDHRLRRTFEFTLALPHRLERTTMNETQRQHGE